MEEFRQEFMDEAIRLSAESVSKGGGPFGAVVVRAGQIVARAHNEVTLTMDPTAHAEVVAIRRACAALSDFQLSGCTIYSSCEPCPMCLGAIYWARPVMVYYANSKLDAAKAGFDDRFIYEEINVSPAHRKISMQQVPDEKAQEVFRKWVELEIKREY